MHVPIYVQDAPPALAEAQDQLQRLVMQRLKELMLLTDWPLVKARRTQLQLDRIYQQGGQHTVDAARDAWSRMQQTVARAQSTGHAG